MPDYFSFKSPYLKTDEAAAYTRSACRTFRDHVRKYKIPKRGPGKNKFHIDDLDDFMANPHCFLVKKRRSRNKGFTPVSIKE